MRMKETPKRVSEHAAIRVLRVLIASPIEARREQWGRALKALAAVHEVGDLVDLQRNMTNLRPTVLLLDMVLPELCGTSDVSAIQRLNPETKIILLTKTPAEDEGTSMLEAGVRGYCTVDIDPELLKKAVQMIHKAKSGLAENLSPSCSMRWFH
jgi:DNA-binding NarL/FixJ family response regulator